MFHFIYFFIYLMKFIWFFNSLFGQKVTALDVDTRDILLIMLLIVSMSVTTDQRKYKKKKTITIIENLNINENYFLFFFKGEMNLGRLLTKFEIKNAQGTWFLHLDTQNFAVCKFYLKIYKVFTFLIFFSTFFFYLQAWKNRRNSFAFVKTNSIKWNRKFYLRLKVDGNLSAIPSRKIPTFFSLKKGRKNYYKKKLQYDLTFLNFRVTSECWKLMDLFWTRFPPISLACKKI